MGPYEPPKKISGYGPGSHLNRVNCSKSLKIEMETLRDLNKNLVPKVAELKKLEQEQKEENKKLQHEVRARACAGVGVRNIST